LCGENDDKIIPVYRFDNNGLGGPTEDTIDGILEDVRQELEAWSDATFGEDKPITLTITTAKMKRSEYDKLPEFEGY
jgi:hypothetical protein